MKKFVFVYGTLKQGYGNNRLLETSQKIADGVTEEEFLLTDVGFPYMIPQEALTGAESVTVAPVRGELWEVTSELVMASLDRLEGIAYDHYRHRDVVVKTADGDFTAQAYVCHNEGAQDYRACAIIEGEYEWGV